MVTTMAWEEFESRVLKLYEPPAGTKAAWRKVRQVCRELAESGVQSTTDLTPESIARWINHFPERKAATTQGLIGYISPVCTYAVYTRVLDRNPLEFRRYWMRENPLPDSWDREEEESEKHLPAHLIERVLAHLKSRAKASWKDARLFALSATLAYTGIRRGEALHLQVRDYRPAMQILDVVPRRRNHKTRASMRPVVAPALLCEILDWWVPQTDSIWLFPTLSRVSPWTGGMPGYKPSEQMSAAGEECGVEGFIPLRLRHSWATEAERMGLSELQIQRQLGHARKTTQIHYRHPDMANQVEGIGGFSFARHNGRGVRLHGAQTNSA